MIDAVLSLVVTAIIVGVYVAVDHAILAAAFAQVIQR